MFLAHLLNQMVTLQAEHLLSSGTITTQAEATNHVVNGELLWQTAEPLVGLLATLHVDAGILQFVVSDSTHSSFAFAQLLCSYEVIVSLALRAVVKPLLCLQMFSEL